MIRNRVMVRWTELGEGWSGDYNPNDPNDEELLRFDVDWLSDDGEWNYVDDASYCTRFPASATDKQKQAGLEILMDVFYEPLMNGQSIKKIAEHMSWIGLDWLEDDDE